MKSKSTKKSSKAYLDKIKSLSFSVGGKLSAPKCQDCGTVMVHAGYVCKVTKYPRTPREREENEQSLSA